MMYRLNSKLFITFGFFKSDEHAINYFLSRGLANLLNSRLESCFSGYTYEKDKNYYVGFLIKEKHLKGIEGLNKYFSNISYSIVATKKIYVKKVENEIWKTTEEFYTEEPTGDAIYYVLCRIDVNENYTDNAKRHILYISGIIVRIFSLTENFVNDEELPDELLKYIVEKNNLKNKEIANGHVIYNKTLSEDNLLLIDNVELANRKLDIKNKLQQSNIILHLSSIYPQNISITKKYYVKNLKYNYIVAIFDNLGSAKRSANARHGVYPSQNFGVFLNNNQLVYTR